MLFSDMFIDKLKCKHLGGQAEGVGGEGGAAAGPPPPRPPISKRGGSQLLWNSLELSRILRRRASRARWPSTAGKAGRPMPRTEVPEVFQGRVKPGTCETRPDVFQGRVKRPGTCEARPDVLSRLRRETRRADV